MEHNFFVPKPPSFDDLLPEASRLAREFIERFNAGQAGPPRVPPAQDYDASTLASQRLALLIQWEQSTSGKRSYLYRHGKPPVISKNQFYLWRKGKLSPRAKATLRLELLLRTNT